MPALIEFEYTISGMLYQGHIGYDDDDIIPALASQTVPINDLQLAGATESNVVSGGVLLSYGEYIGSNFRVDGFGGTLTIIGSTTSVDIGWTPTNLIYDDLPVTILPPKVSVTADASVTEGSSGAFHFKRTGDVSQELTVSYSVGGTATGEDFNGLTGTVTFPAFHSTVDVSVTANDDVTYDPSETLTATVAGAGNPNTASMTILDNGLTRVYWKGGNDGDGNPLNDNDWTNPLNWTSGAVPVSNTAVYFDAAYSNLSVTTPYSVSLAELHLVNYYSGTVTLGVGYTLATGKLELTSGALSQPNAANTISVSSLFAWSGGILNSTPSAAEVNFNGGGSIVLPGTGNTLTTGSTINFGSSGGAKVTTITGSGNLAFTGTSDDGMFIRADAKIDRQKSSGDVLMQLGNKRITIDGPGSELIFKGSDGLALPDTLEGRIVNDGGNFEIRGDIGVRLKGGNANTPSFINSDTIGGHLSRH